MRVAIATAAALCFASPALADPIYKWVDQDGEEHFTNDASTIPAGQKTEITTGEEIGVLLTKKDGQKGDEESSSAAKQGKKERSAEEEAAHERDWRQRFRYARDRVSEQEARVAQDQQQYEALKDVDASITTGPGYVKVDRPAERARALLQQDEAALKRAKTELEQLDREASKQAIPRAWRE
ncbi:MAG TPA: DUF4124 domain-containing protein [Myxococcaceae bacterium]|nr:DUF4124 domain-containing protein [Myxococcaceae bacterium]